LQEAKPREPAAAASGQATEVAIPSAPEVDEQKPEQPKLIAQVDYAGRRPMPNYPRASQRRGETGRVVIRVLISPTGSVENASVQQSSGFDRLDRSALAAAKQARFKPHTENGLAKQALADIPFDFVL
ncbi:MAG TPA: energy transducer TonB, partial [Burkholderiaceae bacterium]|nr:energy transducer TonB [Burkholderiaceae bacterium]